MSLRGAIPGVLVVLAVAAGLGWWWYDGAPQLPPRHVDPGEGAPPEAPAPDCTRIVSMAPSITETLFALGLGDAVVGVTRYCLHPPEAARRAIIGGFYDPNYEAIVGLSPTVVMLLPEHSDHAGRLAELGIPVHAVPQATVTQILASLEDIGRSCGIPERGGELAAALRGRLAAVESRTTGRPRPGVLISVGREMGGGVLRDIFVAGRGTFYDELVGLAGGSNVYDGLTIQYPTLSTEGLLRLNPQVIIEIVPELQQRGLTAEVVIRDWDSLASLNAVRGHRIHVLTEDWAVIPGPRFVLLLDRLARILHPEIEWE
ncbi:MAG: ABC transporter substrate-binding protein [Deltaproteobacteria bacterium]|nr:ABC transporter substrate-binding protein [Deltaproteobacteria bacterium]